MYRRFLEMAVQKRPLLPLFVPAAVYERFELLGKPPEEVGNLGALELHWLTYEAAHEAIVDDFRDALR